MKTKAIILTCLILAMAIGIITAICIYWSIFSLIIFGAVFLYCFGCVVWQLLGMLFSLVELTYLMSKDFLKWLNSKFAQ